MDCVNHQGVAATAYCQNCGKPLCAACIRSGAAGQVLCEPDWMAWQSVRSPFDAPPPGAPNPGLALGLGFIPGVGAMYNGQFLKGFIHVFIFAVLVSLADHWDVFGFGIAAWIAYQVFDAYQTARARRDGLPLPDPLGLNELASSIRANAQTRPVPPAAGPVPPAAGAQQPYAAPGQQPFANPYGAGYPPPPFDAAPPPPAGYPPIPPVPPIPPTFGRPRRVPVAAMILISLGILFLLDQFNWFSGRIFEFAWPVLLIGLGVWLIIRHAWSGRFQGPAPAAGFREHPFKDEPEPAKESQTESQKDSL